MNPLLIYFWGIADRIVGFFTLAAIALVIVAAFLLIYSVAASEWSCDSDESNAATRRRKAEWPLVARKLLAWAILPGLLAVITPSSNTIAMMYVLPEIANSDVVKKDLPEVYEAAKKALLSKLEVPAEKQ